VPLHVVDGWWRLDLDALRAAVSERTRVIFINNASFPSGWVASREEWETITEVVTDRDLRLLYWADYEGVLFDGRSGIHPGGLPGMGDRTVTIGDLLERRMIAWRIAWVVVPGDLVNDLSRVHIYNGLVASGFAQIGAAVPLSAPETARPKKIWSPRTRNGSGGATRPCASSTAFLSYAPREAGRCSSMWPRWASTVCGSPIVCSTKRLPPLLSVARVARSRSL